MSRPKRSAPAPSRFSEGADSPPRNVPPASSTAQMPAVSSGADTMSARRGSSGAKRAAPSAAGRGRERVRRSSRRGRSAGGKGATTAAIDRRAHAPEREAVQPVSGVTAPDRVRQSTARRGSPSLGFARSAENSRGRTINPSRAGGSEQRPVAQRHQGKEVGPSYARSEVGTVVQRQPQNTRPNSAPPLMSLVCVPPPIPVSQPARDLVLPAQIPDPRLHQNVQSQDSFVQYQARERAALNSQPPFSSFQAEGMSPLLFSQDVSGSSFTPFPPTQPIPQVHTTAWHNNGTGFPQLGQVGNVLHSQAQPHTWYMPSQTLVGPGSYLPLRSPFPQPAQVEFRTQTQSQQRMSLRGDAIGEWSAPYPPPNFRMSLPTPYADTISATVHSAHLQMMQTSACQSQAPSSQFPMPPGFNLVPFPGQVLSTNSGAVGTGVNLQGSSPAVDMSCHSVLQGMPGGECVSADGRVESGPQGGTSTSHGTREASPASRQEAASSVS